MMRFVQHFNTGREFPLRLRTGIHTGPVIAGVIGTKKFSYDLWGDTVNTASRMESHGLPGHIHVTQATYERLRGRYAFVERGRIPIKGKGEMTTYLLEGRRSAEAAARISPAVGLHGAGAALGLLEQGGPQVRR
jgi:class 3 adenylate cyclase